MIQQKRVTAIF